jgi:hypothetical protein
MSSILDIDLDYFNLFKKPEQRLEELLEWGDCPIAFIVEKHHKAYSRWKDRVKRGTLTQPSHILHVDEHHDMMDQKSNTNIPNFMYHAMSTWENCRVQWMVDTPIDSPAMSLDDDVWGSLSQKDLALLPTALMDGLGLRWFRYAQVQVSSVMIYFTVF